MQPDALKIGDRVRAARDDRVGVVKWIDYGGIHVELDPTEDEGRELVILHRDDVLPEDQ